MNKVIQGIAVGMMCVFVAACNDNAQQSSNVTIVKSPRQATPEATQPQPSTKWSWLNGVNEQPLTDTNLLLNKNYVFVFDGSGSMEGDRLTIAKKAAKVFSQKLTESDLIGLVVFDYNYDSESVVPLRLNNKSAFEGAVDKIVAGGGTPLESAIESAYRMLRVQGAKQRGYGEYHIVVITDGDASMGQDPRDVVRHIALNSPVNIHSIGFQLKGNHSLNQQDVTMYYQADDYDGLVASFTTILAESNDFDAATFN